ncbi:MAG: FAD-dependent oxidoreductase, partial [Mycobacteriales bacterium]
MPHYDLAVIGAGATGLGAARSARQAGRRVALVESDRPGGDCTHYGCVPSKAMLETARRVAAAGSGSRYGFRADVEVDFGAVMKRVAAVIADVEQDESPTLLTRQGIDLVAGTARFTGPHTLDTGDGTRLTADRFVVATGAIPLIPPIPGLAEVAYLTNKTIFSLTAAPEHLLVLGGGPIGCELAQAFARLGSTVTVIEALPGLLPRDEPEAGRALAEALAEDGVRQKLGRAVEAVSAGPTLHLAGGEVLTGSHLLVADGR